MEVGATCTLIMTDTYGDGWNGAEWAAPGLGQSFFLPYDGAVPRDAYEGTESFVVQFQPPPPPPQSPPQSPLPPASPPPLPSPPPGCGKVMLKTKGWQMLSFNCVANMSNTFDVLANATWQLDDKILTRDPFLKFATFDGNSFVGGLINHDQLLPSLAYKVFYSGVDALPVILEQIGLPQLPVEDAVLFRGWNWIGHAPLTSYDVNTGITPVGDQTFTFDDQIKTRSGIVVRYATHDGTIFQGLDFELEPGVGYEVKVHQDVTFRYTTSPPPSPPPPFPSPPPPSPPPPAVDPGLAQPGLSGDRRSATWVGKDGKRFIVPR